MKLWQWCAILASVSSCFRLLFRANLNSFCRGGATVKILERKDTCLVLAPRLCAATCRMHLNPISLSLSPPESLCLPLIPVTLPTRCVLSLKTQNKPKTQSAERNTPTRNSCHNHNDGHKPFPFPYPQPQPYPSHTLLPSISTHWMKSSTPTSVRRFESGHTAAHISRARRSSSFVIGVFISCVNNMGKQKQFLLMLCCENQPTDAQIVAIRFYKAFKLSSRSVAIINKR